jgi:hypothetical protein
MLRTTTWVFVSPGICEHFVLFPFAGVPGGKPPGGVLRAR